MKLLKLILAFYILHCAFCITSAQVQQDRKIVRGNVTSITVKYPGDITADSLIFQVRGTSSYSSNVYIQKKNTVAGGSSSEIATSYTYPYTTATIYFSSANTSGLAIANYYYDLRKSVSPDSAVLIYGTFKIQSYAGEVVNGLAGGGSNESIIKSWIGDSADYSTGTTETIVAGGVSRSFNVTTKSEPVLTSGTKKVRLSNGKVLKDSSGKVIKVQ